MKVRTDFVTNSSSSSFVTIKIESEILANIIRKFQNDIVREMTERYNCFNIDVTGNLVEYQEEGGDYEDTPQDLLGALNFLISIFYFYDEESFEIWDFDEDGTIQSLVGFERTPLPVRIETVKEIYERRNEILADIESVEINTTDFGWGGDDDSRYSADSYDEDVLNEIYHKIAKENGIPVENVTEDDLVDYALDKTSVGESIFTYDKKTGVCESTFKYYLEDE